ncbi:DUF488 domain-containing protein [Dokdonella sp.]|uniref:DUF488 domain-containing protein n=1 Tax=Dokdonella sp. TaxID=2291710 RepID=UPI003C40A29C
MTRRTAVQLRAIRIRRAYDEPGADDGYRVLVDRYWPRGRRRESLKLDEWARELAPEPDLIKWFGHMPERWDEFRQRYLLWLDAPGQMKRMSELLESAGDKAITLVYGARDETQNQAVIFRDALQALQRAIE